jgi:hypothetical protein
MGSSRPARKATRRKSRSPKPVLKSYTGKRSTTKKSGFKTRKAATSQVTEFGLKRLAVAVFGEEAIRILQAKGFNVREIWELHSSPTVQCNNTIGPVKYSSTECWICGLPVKQKIKGLTPECDHVLPIAQAIIFLSLYRAGVGVKDEEKLGLELEYGWAHNVCNQEKSDMCPIVKNASTGKFQINDGDIRQMLSDIYVSNRSQEFTEELVKVYRTKSEFISGRLGVLKSRYKDIIRFFLRGEGEQFQDLFILAGYATLHHPDSIHPRLHSMLLDQGAINESIRSLNENRVREIRSYLGFSNQDQILHRTQKIMELHDVLRGNVEKIIAAFSERKETRVTGNIGKIAGNTSILSTYTHSLDFLQAVFMKFGKGTSQADVDKTVKATSLFLARKYFEFILGSLRSKSGSLEKIRINKDLEMKLGSIIEDISSEIKANFSMSVEDLDNEYMVFKPTESSRLSTIREEDES